MKREKKDVLKNKMIKEKKWNLNEIVDNYNKWDEIVT